MSDTRVLFDPDRKGSRHCGDCQLCCKLLPVRGIDKKANERCKYQRAGKGCTVYHSPTRGFPSECYVWSCRWLLQESGTENMRRPDRAHYCLDMLPDYVTLVNDNTGEQTNIEVVQIWCDKDFPDAHRDPALRAYLEAKAMPGLVRYSANEALNLVPPSCSHDRQWHEMRSNMREQTHSLDEIARAIGTAVIVQ